MKTYEVEIKSLLGSKEKADKLKGDLKKKYPDTELVSHGKQLNHYFNTPHDLGLLIKNTEKIIPAEKRESLDQVLNHGQKISLRSRETDSSVLLVIKGSMSGDTSANGVKRIEFETKVNLKLDELDQVLLDSGCTYQAKWSREREEYASGDIHVCIDKNAGYGYLAEFEKMVTDENRLDKAKDELLSIMEQLESPELPQDRLERMFAHYNAHWAEYYGTDKTFLME